MPTAVSLFTGCGGSDCGVTKAGFDVVFANDILPYAKSFYDANLPETEYRLGNIGDIRSFPDADLLIGCYPCQGFSVGGVREADRKINYLYRDFARALASMRPRAFIVENVAGMMRQSHARLLTNQLVRFRLAGYRVKHSVLDARAYGVPQERSRLFIVGIRSDFTDSEYAFPPATHRYSDSCDPCLPSCPTIRDAIGDLPEWPDGEFDTQRFHWYYMSRNRWRGWDQQARTVVARSRHVSLHPMSPRLKRIDTDHWEFESDLPARRFSYREASRLQGFDHDVEFPESAGMTMKYQVIGNAVPPPLFEAVAKALPSEIW